MSVVSARRACTFLGIYALIVAGCAADGHKATAPAPTTARSTTAAAHAAAKSSNGSEILFVVQGHDATALKTGDAWQLSVAVNDAPVVWFTDRPLRHSSRLSAEKFVAEWARNGFASDPPNAALTGVGGGKTYDVVVELRNPKWNATTKTLTFDVKPLENNSSVPSALDEVSLFVDDAQNTISLNIINLTQVLLQIQSASPDISTWTSSQSPTIGWDFGEGSSNGPSLNISYTNPNPGVAFVGQFILVGNYQNQWQLTVRWDGNGNPSATITQFSGQGVGLMNQHVQPGVPVTLANLNPDYGQNANYQVVFSQAQGSPTP